MKKHLIRRSQNHEDIPIIEMLLKQAKNRPKAIVPDWVERLMDLMLNFI